MHRLSAIALRDQFLKGELSAMHIAQTYLARVQKHDPLLGAFLCVLTERLLSKAKALDEKRARGAPMGKLAAVPICIKDNIHIKGQVTTCGSRMLANYLAPFDATVVERLEEQDALILGKSNLDEFAMGSSTEHSAFQCTKNPWDLQCTPGGSSGGSAAAVSARLCPLALGSDTGGSIRQPAAFTGIVGFKPTYGRVSRYGLVAFASSLDQIGPFATCVSDAALLMEVIGVHDPRDATSLQPPAEPHAPPPAPGSRIGIPWRFLEDLPAETRENFQSALAVFQEMGMTLVDINLDLLQHAIAVYYILATAEASTNLARFDGVRYGLRSARATTLDEVYDFSRQEGFGREVKNRILLGTYVLSAGYKEAYYHKAQRVRTRIIQQFAAAFSQCDLIALPCTPTPAFPFGAFQDPLQMYLQDIYTVSVNLAGLPAISIPSGWSRSALPFGLQLIGPLLQDARVLAFASAFESTTEYGTAIPKPFDGEVRA